MNIVEFKCPNCGGPIEFDAGTQEMACPYCDSTLNVEALQDLDGDPTRGGRASAMKWGYGGANWAKDEEEGLAVYSCRSCGGEIVADETLGATTCPFCDNPVVLTSRFSDSLRPNRVIPFKKTKAEAIQALKQHYLGKRLLPEVFKDQNHLEEIKGVYVPFWLFDAETDADLEYSSTRTRVWSDRKYRYTETSFYRNYRSGTIGFCGVPVDGSKAIDDVLMQSIEPFQMEEAVDFQIAYLAGYFANKYDLNAKQAEKYANERIENSTELSFQQTVQGFSMIKPVRTAIELKSGKVEYVLLPVWFLSTKWKDQSYTFAMNGQTGRFVGDLPLDRRAFWAMFGKTFGITAVLLITVLFTVISLM